MVSRLIALVKMHTLHVPEFPDTTSEEDHLILKMSTTWSVFLNLSGVKDPQIHTHQATDPNLHTVM